MSNRKRLKGQKFVAGIAEDEGQWRGKNRNEERKGWLEARETHFGTQKVLLRRNDYPRSRKNDEEEERHIEK